MSKCPGHVPGGVKQRMFDCSTQRSLTTHCKYELVTAISGWFCSKFLFLQLVKIPVNAVKNTNMYARFIFFIYFLVFKRPDLLSVFQPHPDYDALVSLGIIPCLLRHRIVQFFHAIQVKPRAFTVKNPATGESRRLSYVCPSSHSLSGNPSGTHKYAPFLIAYVLL